MKLAKTLPIFLIVIALAFFTAACSQGKSPVEPEIGNFGEISDKLPDTIGTQFDNRNLIGVYDAVIDPVAETFTVNLVDRNSQYHFPLTQLYSNALQITGYGFTPNFWADIKLSHPLPGSGIDAYDARVIAIFPANPGVSFNYPTLNAIANNSILLDPDGYTKLHDNLGGAINGNTNPFKAYFKNETNRKWASTGVSQETQKWQMDIAGFGGPLQYKLVVDVSTNFPAPSTPVVDNSLEPVKIDSTVGPGLTSAGGSAEITVTLFDWQGRMTVGGVLVEAPDLFNSTLSLAYSSPGPNPNEYIYSGTITNEKLAPQGEYKYLVAAWDQATGIYIYNEFIIDVIFAEDGDLIWAKRAGGTNYDAGSAITTLSDNSTVVTGYFGYTATFGKDEPNETDLESAGNLDIFIARYDPDGALIWAKRAGGTSSDIGRGITTLSDNSIVVTGNFQSSATFGQGEVNQTVLTTAGEWDIFIARYNHDGTLSWAKSAGGTGSDIGWGITTLSDNSTVVTGSFEGLVTFGQGEPNEKILASAGEGDIFIARYNPNGTLSWAKLAGGSDLDYSKGITALSDNSTVVTGYFTGSATFGEGETNQTVLISAGDIDIFLARYNPDGSLAWAKRAGGSSSNIDTGITTLSDNSTVVTGCFKVSATFGPSEVNQIVLISAGDYDIFIAKYNPNGTLSWAKRAGGTGGDSGSGITTLSDNSTVVTGGFGYPEGDPATFGPGEINQTILSSAGNKDIFIARYYPDGSLAWAKSAGGYSIDSGSGITTLSDNSTAVTGNFRGSATFGVGETNQKILPSAGENDIFIARYEP